MRVIFIGIIFIFFLMGTIEAKQYSYVSISDIEYEVPEKKFTSYDSIISIDKSQNLIFEGHTFSPYSECEEKKWVCIFSENLNFAIPLKKIKKLDSWDYKNFHFIKTELPSGFVKTDKIYKIGVFEKNEKKNFTIVYFSFKKGVLGFSVLYEKEAETFWLLGDYGFGYQ